MFRLDILEQLLGNDPESYYSDELTFLREKGLIDQDGSRITLTPEGFRYYGAVAALFWSNEQNNASFRTIIFDKSKKQ
jgi:coproporphyrinogen III oxidase-like Fe-S oxidoreductase